MNKVKGLLIAIILMGGALPLAARESLVQTPLEQSISVELNNEPLQAALDRIAEAAHISFSYPGNAFLNSLVSLKAKNRKVRDVLNDLLKPYPLSFTALDNTVIIRYDAGKANRRKPVRDSLVTVRGRVFNKKEPPAPLASVTVSVKGKSSGTTTDENGYFELKAEKGDVLIFTTAGYKYVEVTVNDTRDNLVISLQENLSALDEVVVTGYSEQKLKHLANAISTVNIQSSVEGKPITQLSQALQGGVTGLTVTQNSGLPGGDAATIKIRGISTLGNSEPLVLVDGVPFNINDIDPTTVESITVLKDAAAASIYGARAANGVIVVTTKRGKAGKVNIMYDGYAGVQKPSYLPEFVDAPKYMEMVNEAYTNTGATAKYTQEAIDKTRSGEDPVNYPNTDWKSLVLNEYAFAQNHTLGVTGGNSVARFAVNASYLDQDGIIKNTSFNRYSLRANTSVTLKENLTMYLDLSMIRKEALRPIERYNKSAGGPGYIFWTLYRVPPDIVAKYPARESDGYVAYGKYAEMITPVAELEKGGYTRSREDNININFQPQWSITPSLKLKGQYLFRTISTGDISNRDAYNFLDYYTNALVFSYSVLKNTFIYKRNYQYLSALLDYNERFGKHTLYAVAGVSREVDNPDRGNQFFEATLASYFVKANYIFNDKYLLETTWRIDGSSRFNAGRKWGQFPSMAAGWNVHNEPFMRPLKWVSNLKLRGSYGLLGNNQNVGLYQYQNLINAGNGTETVRGNPDITWETVSMLDIGADLGLLNNKLGITVDWYNKITNDILLNPPLSLSSGIVAVPLNAGKVRNRGWELAVNYSHNFSSNFRATLNTGFSWYQNEVLSLRGGPYRDGTVIHKEGYALGSYYGFRTDGLLQDKDIAAGVPMIGSNTSTGPIQKAGDIHYLDLNGDGTITDDDQELIGNPNPQGNYFANLRLEYRNVDLEVQVNGFTKTDYYYAGRYQAPLNLTGDGGGTPMIWQTDYWTPSNPGARFPRLTPSPDNNAFPSDFWHENAAFARVRFIQLGYNVRSAWFKKAGITSVRLYANAQNPFTISDMKHLDPETKGYEITYPMMQFYTIGVNIKL